MKWYNKAYNLFILRYFAEKGIQVDQNVSFEKAASISDELMGKGMNVSGQMPVQASYSEFRKHLAAQETLFLDYVVAWRRHPEEKPSTYYFLERVMDGLRDFDTRKIRILESQLPAENARLLFSATEVAEEISHFYKKYLTHPLRRDIDRGIRGRQLEQYFGAAGLEPPNLEGFSDEKVEATHYETATRLLSWSERTTPRAVLDDIGKTLDAHFSIPEHSVPIKGASLGEPKWKCEHKSEYVKVNGYVRDQHDRVAVFLRPAMGDNLVEGGWMDIAFPSYSIRVEDFNNVSKPTKA